MARTSILIGAALVAGVAAAVFHFGGTDQAQPDGQALNARRYAASRLPVINAHLQQAAAGYVIWAGDSNAELFQAPALPCGREVVNAGVSGATTGVYAEMAEKLESARGHAAVLTIGTNNLLSKKRPLDPAAVDRFERDVSRIIDALRARADTVVVTAIPPVQDMEAGVVDTDAVRAYSQRLEAICDRGRCAYEDPFAAVRAKAFGIAKPGASVGIHLEDYRASLEPLLERICAESPSEASGHRPSPGGSG